MTKAKGYTLRRRTDDPKRAARWVLSFPPPDGGRNWLQKTAPQEIRTPAEAERWRKGVMSELALGPKPVRRSRANGPSIRALYKPWYAEVEKRPNLERATVAGYKSAFETHILVMDIADEGEPPQILGDEPAACLDVPFLCAWVRKLRERAAKVPMRGKVPKETAVARKLSPSRIANVVSAMSMFLSDMVAGRKVPFAVNPCLDPTVRREIPERPRSVRTRLSGERPGVPPMEDLQAVVNCLDVDVAVRVRAIVVATAGERDGEIAGLRVRSIVLKGDVPSYDVTEAVQIYGPAGHATAGHLKTASSERALPMHPAARDGLEEWLTVHWPRRFGRAPKPDDFIFPSSDGKGYRPKSAELLRDALKKAGRPTVRGGKAVTFHRARHAFAIALVQTGAPREVRQLLLGHASDGVDEESYTERAVKDLAQHVARIPIAWPAAWPVVWPVAKPEPEIHNDSRSHFRESNSRPTVYETETGLAANGPGEPEQPASREENGHDTYGTTATYGPGDRLAGGGGQALAKHLGQAPAAPSGAPEGSAPWAEW